MKVQAWLIAIILCTVMKTETQAMGISGFILPARYYDATLGRFISPDTVVQDLKDPQCLNRYSYVRNNPLTLVDPTGHSWFSKNVPQVTPFVNPFLWPPWTVNNVEENKQAYVAGGIGYITSGGNPVVAAASFWTEMGMQTGEGREVTDDVAEDVFMDVFDMNPKTSYMFSNIVLRMAAEAAIEDTYVQIAPNQLQAAPLSAKPGNIDGGTDQSGDWFGPSASGGNPGNNYYALVDSDGNTVGTIMDRPLTSIPSISEPLDIEHTGVNLIGYNGTDVPSPLYGSWGVCHTAVNRALFQAGYGSTVTSLGVGGWSTNLSSFIYGNYGGGLYRAAYWGYEAHN